jgi:hypothetical protein
MATRGGSEHHLVLLSFRSGASEADAAAVIALLERSGSARFVDGVVIEGWSDGGPRLLHHVAERPSAAFDLHGWTWLLRQLVVADPGPGSTLPPAPRGHQPMSESFAMEASALATRPGATLALISSFLDPDAAVSALRDVPDAKLVYGWLPTWMLGHMRGAAGSS